MQEQNQYTETYCQSCGKPLTAEGGLISNRSLYCRDINQCTNDAFTSTKRESIDSGIISNRSAEQVQEIIRLQEKTVAKRLLHFGPLEKKAEKV